MVVARHQTICNRQMHYSNHMLFERKISRILINLLILQQRKIVNDRKQHQNHEPNRQKITRKIKQLNL